MKNLRTEIKFHCPECGHQNIWKNWSVPIIGSVKVERCSDCKKQIVLYIKPKIEFKVEAHKIEGFYNEINNDK